MNRKRELEEGLARALFHLAALPIGTSPESLCREVERGGYGAVIREFIECTEEDTHIRHAYATSIAVIAPFALLFLGATSLTQAIEIGGGFFGSIQYLVIAMIALRALPQTRFGRAGLWFSSALFLLAAIGTSVAWW